MKIIISPQLVQSILKIKQPEGLQRAIMQLSPEERDAIAAPPSTSFIKTKQVPKPNPLLPHLITYAPIAYLREFFLNKDIQYQIASGCNSITWLTQIATLMDSLSQRASDESDLKKIKAILDIVVSYYKTIFLFFETYSKEEALLILQLTQSTLDQFYRDDILKNAECRSAVEAMEFLFFAQLIKQDPKMLKAYLGAGKPAVKEKEKIATVVEASTSSAPITETNSNAAILNNPTLTVQTANLAMVPSLLQIGTMITRDLLANTPLSPLVTWISSLGTSPVVPAAEQSARLRSEIVTSPVETTSIVPVVVAQPATSPPEPEPPSLQIRKKRFLQHIFDDTLQTGLERVIVNNLPNDKDFIPVVRHHMGELIKEGKNVSQGNEITVAHMSSVIFWPAESLKIQQQKEEHLFWLLKKVYSMNVPRTMAMERILEKARVAIIDLEKAQWQAQPRSELLMKLISSQDENSKALRQDMLLTANRECNGQAMTVGISPMLIADAQTKEVKLSNEHSPLQQTYRYLIQHHPTATTTEYDKKQWQSRNDDFQKIIKFLAVAGMAESKSPQQINALKEIRTLVNNPFRNLSLIGATRRVESLFSKPLWARLSNSAERIKEPHFRDKIFALKEMDDAALLEEFDAYQEFIQQEMYREKTSNQDAIFMQVKKTLLDTVKKIHSCSR